MQCAKLHLMKRIAHTQSLTHSLIFTAFSILVADPVLAQVPVRLTGNLDPIYSVKISPSELTSIATGLNGINQMTNIQVDINSIYSENDIPAFNAASQEVSRVLIEAAKHLVDMRAIVYKLSIDLQRDTQGRFTQQIYSAYQEHFQKRFKGLLSLFLGQEAPGADQSFNEKMTEAMEMCFTTSCLQDIADAQLDLVEFGQSINGRIDIDSSTRWESGGKGFKSKIVKETIKKTMDEVLATNQPESLYIKMLRVAAAPFVTAANAVSSAGSEFARFIGSPQLSRYKISAEGYKKREKEWKKIEVTFNERVGENYKKIILSGNGAKKYTPPPVVIAQESGNETTNNAPTALSTPEASSFLITLNQRVQKLKANTKVEHSMIRSLIIGDLMQGTADPLAVAALMPILTAAQASGMQIQDKENGAFNFGKPLPSNERRIIYNAYSNGKMFTSYNYNSEEIECSSIQDHPYILRYVDGSIVSWIIGMHIPGVSNHVIYAWINLDSLITKDLTITPSFNLNTGIANSK
jgi:hypothetical protein